MKKSEKIISALLLMALGVLFIILKDSFIGLLMTVAGGVFIVFGVIDIVDRSVPLAIIKIVAGILLVIAGWAIVEAVLYILSGILLVFGGLLLYDTIKNSPRCNALWQALLQYCTPVICIVIGIALLFHNGEGADFVFIFCGFLTVVEGGVCLFSGLMQD